VTLIPDASIPVKVTKELASTPGGDGLQEGFSGERASYVRVFLTADDSFDAGPHAYTAGTPLSEPGGPEDKPLILENVKPGRYWVGAQSARGFAASIRCGETDLLHHPLVVPAGGLSDPIELTLRDDGAQIDGVIENIPAAPGSLLTGVAQRPHIYLIPVRNSTGQFMELEASADGKFSASQIPPGDYDVLAFDRPQPELEYENEEAMGKYESRGQEIRLLPGQDVQGRFRMILGSE
jgi:hypothetical protein